MAAITGAILSDGEKPAMKGSYRFILREKKGRFILIKTIKPHLPIRDSQFQNLQNLLDD